MSIENQLAALTAAVIELTNAVKSKSNVASNVAPAPIPVAQPAPLVVPTPVAPVAAPVVAVAPAPVTVSPSSMPAPPTFAPVAPAPTGAPFTDGKGLIDYVMGSYKLMGAQKGAMIQTVLTGLGYQNINDVKPEHYGALYQGIEALKAA